MKRKLRNTLRSLLPTQHLIRSYNDFAVRKNQQAILTRTASTTEVSLIPGPPRFCGGGRSNYYHFVFDLLLPLFLLIQKSPEGNAFCIPPVGPFKARIHQLFGDRVRIMPRRDLNADPDACRLIGMNPLCVRSGSETVEAFSRFAFDRFGIERSATKNVLLIERIETDPSYTPKGRMQSSGSSLRSIPNHDELRALLESRMNPNFQLHNLRLEKIDFETQIALFANAALVIGQHGAGMANLVWMPRASTVVEINHSKTLNHFNRLCKLKDHQYFCYRSRGPHAPIPVDHFAQWMSAKEAIQPYLRD